MIEDFINTKFNNYEVKRHEFNVFPTDNDGTSGLEISNYAYYDCAGESYTFGLGAHLQTCDPICY